uniref:Myb-like domain-containing protein n=1 Tax=Knipowitschia caucasica TaxID=637954 RepID=A0AAV2J383_KNICA
MDTQHEDEPESRQGNGLPMRYLRLLAPPLQLLSATMWQVVQQGLVQHYGMLEEFVTMVTELVPELMSYNQRAQLILGLRARLVMETCRGEEPLDTTDIQKSLDRIKAPSSGKNHPETLDRIEESQAKFVELVHSLIKDSSKRNHFFEEVFPNYYGSKFDAALEMLVWEFITRLEELLPAPDFTQVAALLGDAPCLLEDCLQSFFSTEDMQAVVEHHRKLGFLEEKGSRLLPMDDCILSALLLPSEAKSSPDSALMASELDQQSPGPAKPDSAECSPVVGDRVLRKRKHADSKDIPSKQPTKALAHKNSSVDEDSESPLISIWGDYTDSPKPSLGSISKWSEEETVLLLDVWSMNVASSRRLQNAQLLAHISRRLNQSGHRRSPEQCGSRMKRLRRYFNQMSGSVGKVDCKFYEQLERILQADPDSTCETDEPDQEEEPQEADEDLQMLEHNLPQDVSTDTVSSSARAAWSDSETLALIHIWGENKHHVGSRGGHRGAQLFNIVSKKMADLGYLRTPDQCQTRMKRLKTRFRQNYDSKNRRLKKSGSPSIVTHRALSYAKDFSGAGQGRVFSELARFMPRDHSLEDEVDRALEELQDDDFSAYFNQDLDAVFNFQEERKKITWTDKETVLLLEIWGDPQVQQDLKRIPHNSPVYNEIADKLAACGYRRSNDQCYTRIKRLKALYRNCLDRLDKGGVKTDFKFYNILEKILGSQPPASSASSTKAADEISEDSNSNSVSEIDGVCSSAEMGHWSDQEVRTLIDIWEEEEVKRSLTGELQNGQMYTNIIDRMEALGFSKTYAQCCLKVKELQTNFQQCYERKKAGKAVQYRFYNQLEPILGPTMEDPDEKDEEAENRPVGDSGSAVWREPETIAFLEIWAAEDIQKNIKSSFRSARVYAEISEKMSGLGYHKTPEQCHEHINKLKKNYRRYCNRAGSRRSTFPYLHIMGPVLGGSGFSADADASSSSSALDSNQDGFTDKDQDAYEQPSTSQLLSDQGKKSTWTDRETRLLLKIWGEDRVQLNLKGSMKNRHVYEHISSTMGEHGFTRSAEQCYTRIKRLKAGYHHEKMDFRYYKELEEVLKIKPKASAMFEDVHLPDVSLADLSFPDMSLIDEHDPNRGLTGDSAKMIWSDTETKVLLEMWASDEVQQNLRGNTKNKHIYSQISTAMQGHGYSRSAEQCQSRIKRLRAGYRGHVEGRKGAKQEIKFFSHLLRAFGSKPSKITSAARAEDRDF